MPLIGSFHPHKIIEALNKIAQKVVEALNELNLARID